MLSLQDRILIALVCGAALGETIYDCVKAYTTLASFKQTLNSLIQEGLVQSEIYAAPGEKNNPRALYALTEAGARHLTENVHLHFRRDEIRIGLPAVNMVLHELVVTEIVRIIRWEMDRMAYDCDYFDDAACKKLKQHLELIGWIPDLLLIIRNMRNYYGEYVVALEVDMGSRDLADVLRAVLGRNCQTLFLCSNTERILQLQAELSQYDELHGMLYFALIAVFCAHPGGVFSIDWMNLSGKTVGLYPKISA